tara:strand:+ start:126 stop:779 length:654 start_codon:yes stop_codon:yes gene_type:complete
MRIFLDTADFDEIRKRDETGLIDGVTTNPSLILKSGGDPVDVIKRIAGEFPHFESISAEVVAETAPEMIDQAQVFKELSNVTIKVPCTVEGLKACKALRGDGFTTNVTLVFSVAQAILAAKADATYVSPFVGRCNDNSFSGVALVQSISGTYREHLVRTNVLSASLRDVHHVSRCFAAGSEVVTMPPKVFDKMYNHVLTDSGLDIFQKDWESVNGSK